MSEAHAAVTQDAFLGGRLRLRQLKRGHRAGHDAILLAAATVAQAGDRVVDFGAGVGAAGLALARRVEGIELTLIEIDPELAALARGNAAANTLPARVVELDIAAGAADFAEAGVSPDSVDVVLMNPPFNHAVRHRPSPDAGRRLAHQAADNTLEVWVHAARRILRPGGALTLIWRAETLADVLSSLGKGFGSVRILPIHPDALSPAIRIIATAVKGGRGPLKFYPGWVLNGANGVPDPQIEAVLRGDGVLPMPV
jgi:tRNA1(Val) A37 N6-methylase TrmN6